MTSSRQLQAASFRSIGGTSGRLRSSTGSSGGRWPSAGLGWDSAWVIRSLIGWFLSRSLLAWLAVAGPAKPSQGGHTGGRPTVPAARRPTLYQRDYLMRQIEQVGRMLAAIIGLAKGGRGDEALGMFDEAYKPLVGVEPGHAPGGAGPGAAQGRGRPVRRGRPGGGGGDPLPAGRSPGRHPGRPLGAAAGPGAGRRPGGAGRGAGAVAPPAAGHREGAGGAGSLRRRRGRSVRGDRRPPRRPRAGRGGDRLLPAPAPARARAAGRGRPDPPGGQRHPGRAAAPRAAGRGGALALVEGPAAQWPVLGGALLVVADPGLVVVEEDLEVLLDGVGRADQPLGDLRGGVALQDQPGDVLLALGQPVGRHQQRG